MEKAYIIIAHKLPDQLYRLVERLNDGLSTFFIHIDIKADLATFSRLSDFGDKVKLVKREDGKWAGVGIIKAVLNGLQAVKGSNKNFDRIILLSGQDYPIKSNKYINDFFKSSPYSVFIEYWPIPDFKVWKNSGGGMFRVNKYFVGVKKYEKLKAKALNFLAMLFPFFKRKLPYNLLPYGGWAWWTIDMYALNYILQFVKDHPKYIKFHKYTFVADEMFIHTILLNSKDEKLLKSITNNNMRYIIWKDYKPHPETLCKNNLEGIKASDALYSRKFDPKKDDEILDLIDKNCLS